MDFAIQALPVLVVLVASVTDVLWERIPNWLTFPAAIVGLSLHASVAGVDGLLFSLKGLAAGFALLIVFYALGGMAAGDVKLLASVGAYLGAKVVFGVFLVSALSGGVYALALLLLPRIAESGFVPTIRAAVEGTKTVLLTGKLDGALTSSDSSPKLRYGVCIALGTMVAVFGADGSPVNVFAN